MSSSIKNNDKATLIFLLLFLFSSCKKNNIEILFSAINSPTSNELSCIKFMNHEIGFACGGRQFDESTLLKTSDGGKTWQKLTLPNVQDGAKQLYALDVLPNGVLQAVGFGGITFYSPDTGHTIFYRQEPRYAHWCSIDFRTANDAYLCGKDGLNKGIIAQIKNSNNWYHDWGNDFHSFGMQHVTFVDSIHGYIAGFGAIYKTTDGGEKWEFTNAKNDHFTATTWFTPTSGVAIGWEGSILKTTDGGSTWEKIRNANNILQSKKRLKALAKNARNELIIVGENGCILYSNDEGNSWKVIESFTTNDLESVSFSKDNTFFAVGDAGRIFKAEL